VGVRIPPPALDMGNANCVLRFVLEIAALVALAYWGFSEFGGVVQR
jgi:Protein of unknown function (DUF2568)